MFRSLSRATLAFCLAGAFTILIGSNASAQDLSAYNSEVLAQAESAYEAGQYEKSVQLARQQLRSNSTPIERVQAYRLQGLSYSAQGKQKRARKAAQDLVILYPTYEPSPKDSPEFAALVHDAQQRHASGDLKPSNGSLKNKLLLGATIGLSVLTIAVGIQSAMMM